MPRSCRMARRGAAAHSCDIMVSSSVERLSVGHDSFAFVVTPRAGVLSLLTTAVAHGGGSEFFPEETTVRTERRDAARRGAVRCNAAAAVTTTTTTSRFEWVSVTKRSHTKLPRRGIWMGIHTHTHTHRHKHIQRRTETMLMREEVFLLISDCIKGSGRLRHQNHRCPQGCQ